MILKKKSLINYVITFFIGFITSLLYSKYEVIIDIDLNRNSYQLIQLEESEHNKTIINFENFNNKTGSNEPIVPNIIHYVHLDQEHIEFTTLLSILSAWLNHKPEFIYFHCNKCNYSGKYWNAIQKINELKRIIRIKKILNQNRKIFNQEPGWIHHLSDVHRLLVLMHYGGIYLDNDMIVINSLNKYRHYEMALSWKG